MEKKNLIDALDFTLGRECDICGQTFRIYGVNDNRRICKSCATKLKAILFDFDRSKVKSAETNYNDIPAPCRKCHNHPSNGGSGVCFCTLCTPKIT